MGDGSTHGAPLTFPGHPSRAGISTCQDGAERVARPTLGQGGSWGKRHCHREPCGSRKEGPGLGSSSAMLLGQADTRAQDCCPPSCLIPLAGQDPPWGLCPWFLFLG